jgi:hypothetical protein
MDNYKLNYEVILDQYAAGDPWKDKHGAVYFVIDQ